MILNVSHEARWYSRVDFAELICTRVCILTAHRLPPHEVHGSRSTDSKRFSPVSFSRPHNPWMSVRPKGKPSCKGFVCSREVCSEEVMSDMDETKCANGYKASLEFTFMSDLLLQG